MQLNLNDWLGDHPWAWWLVLTVLLVGAEAVHRGRIALGLACGAMAGAVAAAVAPTLGWAQALVAGGVGAGGVAVLTRRPARDEAGPKPAG